MPEFCLLVVPGVSTDKWSRMWIDRVPGVRLRLEPVPAAQAHDALRTADAGLVRLPVDAEAFHAIPLYTESTVVVVPRTHLVAAAEEVTLADLVDDPLLWPFDDVVAPQGWPAAVPVADHRPDTTAAAVELVAAEAGLLVVPQSLARAHHRKDLTYRVVTDAPTSPVGLAWRRDGHTDLVEEMIGIVRGRTPNSTRGRPDTPPRTGGRAPAPARRGPAKRRGR